MLFESAKLTFRDKWCCKSNLTLMLNKKVKVTQMVDDAENRLLADAGNHATADRA